MTGLIARLRQGIPLPPSGLALAGMLAFYVLAGLLGRDPWKGEDAIHIGVTWNILAHADWLSPELAGRPLHAAPLYYWSAALTGRLFSWLLPLHDAIRLASGLWVALALGALYHAARELYGKERAAAAPLLLAGCTGLILHSHDAQPMLVAFAAYCGTLAAISLLPRQPRLGALYYGLSLTGCFLGTGITATLPLLLAGPLAIWFSRTERSLWHACLLGWAIFLLLVAPWLVALAIWEPERLSGWLHAEWTSVSHAAPLFRGLGNFLGRLPTLAFPAFFIAGWSLWTSRKRMNCPERLLPLFFFLFTLVMLSLSRQPDELPGLLLLPPLALLATPGALELRRGATNALNWFAMMAFSFFAALVWLGWSALTLGWPQKLAQRTQVLRPGFSADFNLLSVGAAILCTLWWVWLMRTTPRSPYRSLVHWAMGFTILWTLITLLWMPWVDYGRSYRPVSEAIAQQLPKQFGCLAERNLGDSQRASLAYFTGVEARPYSEKTPCQWLLTRSLHKPVSPPSERWKKVWQGSRPGERKERFTLYRRADDTTPPSPLATTSLLPPAPLPGPSPDSH